uniref:SPE-like protein n=1 Tax=Locusta migratoria migratoria TaxID=238695 RepID=A0A411DFC0_LOCMI|nr:SPE-like protein [Locusta migratoria migratoria]
MLLTYVCAAIVATTSFGVASLGGKVAADIRRINVKPAVNEEERGQCVHITSCPYLANLLMVEPKTPAQRILLSKSQCGLDNRVEGLVNRILVCCPQSMTGSGEYRFGTTPSDVANGTNTTLWEFPWMVLNRSDGPGLRFALDIDLSHRQFLDDQGIVQNRIIGGKGATIEEFPFMASLERHGRHLCSMCVVTPSWLITAGFCFFDIKTGDFVTVPQVYAIVAATSLLTNKETRECIQDQQIRAVRQIILHPKFNLKHPVPDLALVRAMPSLRLCEQLQPAHLPEPHMASPQYLHTNRRCYIAGWGEVSAKQYADRLSSVSVITGLCMVGPNLYTLPLLQKVTMPLLSLKDCLNKYPWASWLLEEEHICTLSLEGKDACWGDVGGPLVCDGFVVALVSAGVGCANKSNPTVYTRVDKHLRWIERTSDLWRMNLAPRQPKISIFTALGHLLMALAGFWHA